MTNLLKQYGILFLSFMLVLAIEGSVFAQETEDPFAQEEGTDSPFQGPESDQENEAQDPFAEEETPQPQAPPEEDPFVEDQEEESPFDQPGTSESEEEAEDPFQAPEEEEPGSPFDQPETDTQADPFAVGGTPTPTPVQGAAPSAPAAESTVPLGRPVLRYEDQRLRRLAEIRGLWIKASEEGLQSTGQISDLAEDFKTGDFNRAYVETRTVNGMTFLSELEASLPYISVIFSNPIEDLQEEIGDTASTIAVVDTLQVYNAAVGSRPPEQNPISRFPEFTSTSVNGDEIAPDNHYYLDPVNPLVRQYLAAMIFEIETKVRPTGYLLKGLRYPGSEWGYSDAAVEAFREEVGGQGPPPPDNEVWSAWRREQLVRTIREIRQTIDLVRPGVPISVMVEIDGSPPQNWEEWTSSDLYSEYMQDWIGWCRNGVISELVFEYHETVDPRENALREWLPVINSNIEQTRPVISFSGEKNYRDGLMNQFNLARGRAIGTILHHYADPSRDFSRGFFASLQDTIFRGAPGYPVGGGELTGPQESRQFAQASPPPSVDVGTPTSSGESRPLTGGELQFASPTPIPTPTPEPTVVPENVSRTITMRNGRTFEARVLQVSSDSLTIQPTERADAQPVDLPRAAVSEIEPPLD